MKFRIIILLFACTIFFSHSVMAKSQSTMKELNHLADEALQLTKFGRFEEAKNLLEQFGELFAKQGPSSNTLTMDELRVVTAVHHEALNSLTSMTLSHEDRVKRVTAFRLATDAISSQYQPLWFGMEDTIIGSFQNVKNAALEGDTVLYNEALNDFLATYAIIQPSLKIDLSVEEVQKLDSRITYIDRYRSSFADQTWLKELEQIEKELKSLFSGINDDNTDPSIWWVIMMTGGIIVTTLSYVSWRQYRGEKKFKKSSKKRRI
ncbi:sporulation protein YpjB [Lederbergia galactosidilytica]|uniref:Sporulation protein n=1 Tax=Lederbergia galactosidilytica TaxID=217031 RepID=A0A177ZQR9_9BACI|nr:sporulation protein YpjB [Lederbergia galactosidilytica]KRG12499.1 sporulation protein [Virgibacillus soli]MBP1914621.1 sporulation protein YpjB [Lederbergia galactosidilytica]OAK69789.1 sporulation protein [Lederbergia galactosidilytica]